PFHRPFRLEETCDLRISRGIDRGCVRMSHRGEQGGGKEGGDDEQAHARSGCMGRSRAIPCPKRRAALENAKPREGTGGSLGTDPREIPLDKPAATLPPSEITLVCAPCGFGLTRVCGR